MKTYLWYDYETFGTDTRRDRIAQFAGIRTDENFKIIDRIEHYCQLAPDYIPNYEACLVTGITPQMANRRGMSEEKLASVIFREFNKKDTVSIGYNSIKFDDEVTRNLFYRTLRDPYTREWKDGCSRWDFMRAVLGFYLIDKDVITWSYIEDKVSFRLEKLTAENGISHKNAHDAMSDVKATIAFAKLLHDKNEKLYDYIFALREKNYVNNLLRKEQIFLHGDFSYGSDRDYQSLLYKVNIVKTGANDVIFLDLNSDLEDFKYLEVEELRELLYKKNDELDVLGRKRPGVKILRTNQSPLLFPWTNYSNKGKFDREHLEKQVKLAREIEMKYGHKLAKIFEVKRDGQEVDIELDIYGGFPSNTDKGQFTLIHQDVKGYRPNFENKKYDELYFRWKAKNHFDLLSDSEREKWEKYCYDILATDIEREGYLNFTQFEQKVVEAREIYATNEEALNIIDKVEKYVVKLKKENKKKFGPKKKRVLKKKSENLTLF